MCIVLDVVALLGNMMAHSESLVTYSEDVCMAGQFSVHHNDTSSAQDSKTAFHLGPPDGLVSQKNRLGGGVEISSHCLINAFVMNEERQF